MLFCRLLFTTVCFTKITSQLVEEFTIHGPMEFHDEAMKEFVNMRREDPNATIDYDGAFMTRARAHAVKRLAIQPEEELSLRVN